MTSNPRALRSPTSGGALNIEVVEAIAALTRAVVGSADAGQVRALLYQLGKSVPVDIVAITRTISGRDKAPYAEVVHWLDTDAPFLGGNPHEHWESVSWDLLPHTRSKLERGEFHSFERLDDLAPSDLPTYLNSPAHIRSGIELPITVGEEWAGHVLLANRTEGRRWSDIEVLVLQALADVFAGAWERDRSVQVAREALEQRNITLRHQRALTECSRVLLAESDDAALENALGEISAAFGHGVTFYDQVIRTEGHRVLVPQMALTTERLGRELPPPISQADWPSYWHQLQRGRVFKFWNASELELANDLARRAVRARAEAMLVAPIMVDGRLEAVIGVESPTPWSWTGTEERTLLTTAAMLGSFLERRRTLDRLQDLVRAKDQFVASVSHEIRTPMTVVYGLASALANNLEGFTQQEIQEFIELISLQTHDITNLVEDLLVAARMDVGITVIPALIDVRHEIGKVLEALPEDAAAKTTIGSADACCAWADGLRLRQILRNLVMNAHRHGGPNIMVSATVEDGTVIVCVADDGPGIEPAVLERIFDPYVSDAAASGRPGSIGLGLTVSRDLAVLMNGRLSVQSRPGQTIFVLELPAADQDEPAG